MRIEKNIHVDGRYVASQKVGEELLVATGDTAIEAIDKVFDKISEDEPVRGMCYHIDCDDDHCRCWDDIDELRKHLKGSTEMQKRLGLHVSVGKDKVVHLQVKHLE